MKKPNTLLLIVLILTSVFPVSTFAANDDWVAESSSNYSNTAIAQVLQNQPLTSNSVYDGLISFWNFDESTGTALLDSSGNNYLGTIHEATRVSHQDKYALKLNGVSDYVDVPSLPVSNLDSLTVVAWINSDFSQIGYIFYHGETGEFLLHNGERTGDGPVAGRYPDLASFSVKLAGSTWHDVYSSALEPNVWHQIVGTWTKGASLKIYVDGALAGENSAISSGYLLNLGSSWLPSLGVYNRGAQSDTYFKGLLDDVMVYDRALSANEIASLYANTISSTIESPTPSLPSTPTLAVSSTPGLADVPAIPSGSTSSGNPWFYYVFIIAVIAAIVAALLVLRHKKR